MIKVVLLGTGNVASYLFQAFSTPENIEVTQVYNHSEKSLTRFSEKVDTTTSLGYLKKADVYILALKDDVIPKIGRTLKDREGLVVHTSGAVSIKALDPCSRPGIFYPLQTFSKNREVQNKKIPFCLEAGHPEDLELLKELSRAISGQPFEVDSEQRKKLHLSAVFVCNFVNHLYSVGERICKENDLPFDILQPLIQETASKVTDSSPLKVQTGPAFRRDQSTIDAHLELISTKENKEIYQLLTKAIQSVHGKEL